MRLLESNAYFLRLTKGEPAYGWYSKLIIQCVFLWLGSCLLIRANLPFGVVQATSSVELLVCGLVILALLIVFVFAGVQISVREVGSEQLALLRLTHISQETIFWSLVLAILYRIRHWLTWIIGGSPYLYWLICQWLFIQDWTYCPGQVPGECSISLLGTRYRYFDGPSDLQKYLTLLWFIGIAVSLFGITCLAVACSVSFAIKSKNIVLSAATIIVFLVPIVFIVILFIMPEWFLYIDSAYGKAGRAMLPIQVIGAGLTIAIIPFAFLRVTRRILLRWAFSSD
jgi:hypothetical protein